MKRKAFKLKAGARVRLHNGFTGVIQEVLGNGFAKFRANNGTIFTIHAIEIKTAYPDSWLKAHPTNFSIKITNGAIHVEKLPKATEVRRVRRPVRVNSPAYIKIGVMQPRATDQRAWLAGEGI